MFYEPSAISFQTEGIFLKYFVIFCFKNLLSQEIIFHNDFSICQSIFSRFFWNSFQIEPVFGAHTGWLSYYIFIISYRFQRPSTGTNHNNLITCSREVLNWAWGIDMIFQQLGHCIPSLECYSWHLSIIFTCLPVVVFFLVYFCFV